MKKLFSYIIVSLCVINLYGQTLIATSSHPDATANHNQRKIVRDTLDNVYIVYQDIIEGDTVIMGLYFDRMSEIWTTPTQITTGKNPTISISKDCIFHLFYELNGSVTNIMYRRSDDFNTWTGELLLSDPLVESVLPIADVDSSGLVNVMWISGEDEETILRLCRIKNDEIIKDTVLLEKPYISDITIANHLLFGNQTIMYAVNFDIDSIYYFSKLEFFDEADLLYATEGTNPCVTYNYFYDTIYDFTSSFHFPYINSIGQVRSVYGDHATVGFKNQYVYESLLGDWGAKYVCVDDVLLPLGYSFLFLNDQGLYHVFAGDGGVYKMMDSIETGSPYNPSIAYRHFRFDLVDFIWTDSTSGQYNIYYTRRDKYTEIYEYDNIGDNLHESEITAYPNPFKEQIQINLLEKYSDIQIYDNSGQVILKKHIEDNVFIWDGNDENGYNVKPGNYVVSIISGDSKFLGKIIKIE